LRLQSRLRPQLILSKLTQKIEDDVQPTISINCIKFATNAEKGRAAIFIQCYRTICCARDCGHRNDLSEECWTTL